ncbi:MAG TPA: T9SS type A sorting domain-containing protein, partial [Chitinophagaceae bacterium]|nr:T9SS type A sorting domain-containing protein [Chitinophagaceae bacterium]
SSRLRHLGTGCTMKLFDSLNVDTFIINLKHILEMVHNSSNGFYLQTIFFSQPDLNIPGYTDKLVRVMDSVNSWVNMGWAEWKTLKQSYTWWEQTYAKQMFQKSCAEVTSVMDDVWKEKEYLVFPNPAHHELCFRGAEGYSKELYDVMGKLIMTTKWDVMDVHDIPAGIYFLRCQNKTLKVIIE